MNSKKVESEVVCFYILGGNPFGGGSPFGAGRPFGQATDAEEIFKSFFSGRDNPFGFASGGRGFDNFTDVQQVSAFFKKKINK